MSGIVVETSVWIEFLAGTPTPELEDALAHRAVVLPPIVVAELVSGARRARDRAAITDLVAELHVIRRRSPTGFASASSAASYEHEA